MTNNNQQGQKVIQNYRVTLNVDFEAEDDGTEKSIRAVIRQAKRVIRDRGFEPAVYRVAGNGKRRRGKAGDNLNPI